MTSELLVTQNYSEMGELLLPKNTNVWHVRPRVMSLFTGEIPESAARLKLPRLITSRVNPNFVHLCVSKRYTGP